MPQAADIVINNGAGTPVAKTFTLLSPASGYQSWANWALKEGTISSVFPKIAALARATGNNAYRSQLKLRIPSSYTDSVTGLTKVGSAWEMNVDTIVPNDFPEALKADAIAFAKNLLAHAIVQAIIRDGQPAT